MDNRLEKIETASNYIIEKIGTSRPEIGIVLGSGLGRLADVIENPIVIPYSTIPGFPVSTAIGHKGNLIIGNLGGKTVFAMQGRFHYYEGYDMSTVTIGIRVMSTLGIKYLFVSNAAGGCNPDYHIGDLMIIKDHINMFPNPLIGPNLDKFGSRFPDMTASYDIELISKAEKIASESGYEVKKGVYLGSTGPTYETPAEVRFFRLIGADALGMSTIPEVIVGRHCGMRVFGMSVITNEANYDNASATLNDEKDVVIQADIAASKMITIFTKLIGQL